MRRLPVIALMLPLLGLSTAVAGTAEVATDRDCPRTARVARDIRYRSVEGVAPRLLSLDVYEPAARGKCSPAPVVMWVHGGGWSVGDKRNAVADKVRLFNGAGYVFVSVNYRLTVRGAADPFRYPTHNEDVAAAVAWVVAHIADHGGDPHRVALLGHSAGAQIVASVSTDERYLAEHDLGLDALRCTGALDTEGFDVTAIASRPVGGRVYRPVFGDDPTVWRDASPITHVAPDKQTPDMLLVERGTAARRAVARRFADALRGAGVDVIVVDGTGLSHGDVNKLIGAPGDGVMTPAVERFLAGCFR